MHYLNSINANGKMKRWVWSGQTIETCKPLNPLLRLIKTACKGIVLAQHLAPNLGAHLVHSQHKATKTYGNLVSKSFISACMSAISSVSFSTFQIIFQAPNMQKHWWQSCGLVNTSRGSTSGASASSTPICFCCCFSFSLAFRVHWHHRSMQQTKCCLLKEHWPLS